MKSDKPIRALLQDFHGPSVWVGAAMGLVGYVALEWGFHNSGLAATTFLGGQQLGMGFVVNRYAREAKQSNQTMKIDQASPDGQPADRGK